MNFLALAYLLCLFFRGISDCDLASVSATGRFLTPLSLQLKERERRIWEGKVMGWLKLSFSLNKFWEYFRSFFKKKLNKSKWEEMVPKTPSEALVMSEGR